MKAETSVTKNLIHMKRNGDFKMKIGVSWGLTLDIKGLTAKHDISI